jgi:DNA-binding PadR family transcriptional regulator
LGLAKRILHVSEGILNLNQGTLYPALLRLEQRRWITSRRPIRRRTTPRKQGIHLSSRTD